MPTQEALLSVTNSWHKLLAKNQQVAAVFFDVKKAFDSVPHHQLISSLEKTGIRGPLLKWILDYLSGREQRVVLDGTTSDPTPVTSGVPQGSILGPLLFNIFMNSISELPISQKSNLILYADDILLYRPVSSATDAELLQKDVNLVLSWMKSNGLTPNYSKTQFLPITRSRKAPTIYVLINGERIQPCNSVKYLGVTISANLSWSQHISLTCRKAKQHLGLIHRKLNQSPGLIRHQIYRAAVLPKLEYCASVWDPHHLKDINAVDRVQKFAAKVITCEWKSDYPTLCSKLNWQTLSTRRKIQKLKVCFNIMNNLSIIPPSTFIPHPHPSPRHPHSKVLFIPYTSTYAHKFSFFVDVIPLWNSLPPYVINSPSASSFKYRITNHFLSTS